MLQWADDHELFPRVLLMAVSVWEICLLGDQVGIPGAASRCKPPRSGMAMDIHTR